VSGSLDRGSTSDAVQNTRKILVIMAARRFDLYLAFSFQQIHSRVPHSFAFFANEWASANKGEAHTVPVTKLRDRTSLDLDWPLLKFHPHQSSLLVLVKVRTKAAPLPLLPH
jgi:hypothetical protein